MSGLRSGVGDDGRKYLTVSQSWLNEYFNCPERARRKAFDHLQDGGTDATAIGTGVHSGAEARLVQNLDFDAALDAAVASFRKEAEHPDFRYVQVKSEDTAIKYLTTCLTSWWTDILPQLGAPVAVEHPFKVYLFTIEDPFLSGHEDDVYDVYLTGVIDYVDANGIIWDWKTANDAEKYGKRKHWEFQRWSIQPTAYTMGWHAETGEYALFMFACMLKGVSPKAPLLVPVQRDETHWGWMVEQIRGIVTQALVNPQGPWALRDQNVLCSPKWCPAWADCKGRFVTM